MASRGSSKSKGTGVVELKEILSSASKYKQALYDIDVFNCLPDDERENVEKMCADFATKCKRLKPAQLDPNDTPVIIGMLLVDNRRLRDVIVSKREEVEKLKGIVKQVKNLNDTITEDNECKSVSIDLKAITRQDSIGKKLFQVMPFPHIKPVKNTTTASLEDLGITPDSEFGKTCLAFWTSYYSKNKQLINASIFEKVVKDPEKMRLIWYDYKVGQFIVQDNAKRRTSFKHGLFKILRALRNTTGNIFVDVSFDEFAAAMLDVALVNHDDNDEEHELPMNEKQVCPIFCFTVHHYLIFQLLCIIRCAFFGFTALFPTKYEVLKGFLALAALFGEGNTKKKYIENDKELTKKGEERLNGKEISKEMTLSKESVALLIAVKYVIKELESNNSIRNVIATLCDDFQVEDLKFYSGKRAVNDRMDSNAENTNKDWGFTQDEIQLYNSLFLKLKRFRELDSKREFSKKIAAFRYDLHNAARDGEELRHHDTRESKRPRTGSTFTGMQFNLDDLNYFGISEV
jgi:hypothetical protein